MSTKATDFEEGEIEESFKRWRTRIQKKYGLPWHEVERIVKEFVK